MQVYLFGNCQTRGLSHMMAEDHPDWTIAAKDLSALVPVTAEDGEWHLDQVRRADVVITQPVHDWKGIADLSLRATTEAVRPDALLILLPSIVFEGLHGAFTYLSQRLGAWGMEYHNSHTLDMVTRGYRREDIHLLQASPEFYTREFIDLGIAASLAELRAREALHEVSISVADLIDEDCRSVVVMNTINHPKRPLLSKVLNAIYGKLSLPAASRPDGTDYLGYPFIPPLPTVLARLGIPDDRPEVCPTFEWSASRDEYLAGSIDYYSRLVRATLLGGMQASRTQGFLQSFHRGSVPPADRSRPAVAAPDAEDLVIAVFGALLHRQPKSDEVQAHLAAIGSLGLHGWLDAVASADEFHRINGVPAKVPDQA